MKKPDRTIKIRPEYHLIVTEGTGTEPAYFGATQEIINKDYPEKIQLKVLGAVECLTPAISDDLMEYHKGTMDEKYYCEIWIPVKQK